MSAAEASSSPGTRLEAFPPVENAAEAPSFHIQEYRITGSALLSELEKGRAVYPFLGPGRTATDVESARAALEKIYKDKGFETVFVEAPVLTPRRGVVELRVQETTVGRVRVTGARHFLPSRVAKGAPSLVPGKTPNLGEVQRDLLALNQWPDRRVTPVLKAGAEPGTVDIDLNVEDTLPLHGSLELNNRSSQGTTDLRLNASLSHNNLWQLGHSMGASFQGSPESWSEVQVFSGYYLARFASLPRLSLILQGTKQNSNVSTLGGSAVAGRGDILGTRAILSLPPGDGFYHSASFGFDYKRFEQVLNAGATELTTPITYYPFTLGYSAGWSRTKSQTDLNADVVFSFSGTGSDDAEFDSNRYNARSSFIYLRADASHTAELRAGTQLHAKLQGQVSSQPLVASEQFTGGGLGSARGYLEAEAVGDQGVLGSLELRSPSLLGRGKRKDTEWRIYGFFDAGLLALREPLPEQKSRFELASLGIGTHLQIFDLVHGSLDMGLPLKSASETQSWDPRFTFRLWSEF